MPATVKFVYRVYKVIEDQVVETLWSYDPESAFSAASAVPGAWVKAAVQIC